MRKSDKVSAVMTVAVLLALMVVVVFPIVYVLASSLKTNSEIVAYPGRLITSHPTFENYAAAFTSDVFDLKHMLANSLYYTFFCVLFTLVSSLTAGYVFARGEFRLKGFLLACFSLSLFFSMGTVTLYPTFAILRFLHIPKSLTGLLFIKIFSIGIVNVYLVRSFIYSIPKEIDKAAEIDGCNFIQILIFIILPMLKPIIATIGIVAFQGSWNDYLMPMVFTLSSPKSRPLVVGLVALSQSGEAAANYNIIFASTILALAPVLIVYAFCNKYFISGLAAGAVKG